MSIHRKHVKATPAPAILTRTEPLAVTYDMNIEEHDQEEVITAEYTDFFLVTVLTPTPAKA